MRATAAGGTSLSSTLSAPMRSPQAFKTLNSGSKREVTLKYNDGLNRLFESKANAVGGLFDTMQLEPEHQEGKRLFRDRVNISHPETMYPVETDKAVLASFIEPKSTLEYPDKTGIIYVKPPVVKAVKERHSFVHN